MKFETISVIGLGYIGLPTAAVIASNGILDAECPFIRKPFARDELAAKIREILGA